METISITGQAAQCKGIYREAMNLQNDDWFVMADHVSGFIPPPEFEGYIPDIYAIKEELSYIILVVTNLEQNWQEIKTLREYSKHYSNIQFYCWLVNEAGCRVKRIE